MSTSPDLGLPLVASQQAQPEITHNEALFLLQALAMGVLATGSNTPPGSPVEGDSYILGAAPTGAWSGRAKAVAIYTASGWRFVPDKNSAGTVIAPGARHAGMRVPTRSGTVYKFDGTNWSDIAVAPSAVTAYVSGVTTGCEYSATAGTAVFSIAAGTLRFVDDYTAPLSPTLNTVSFAGVTNTADAYASSPSTYVGINSSGAVVQQTTPFTEDDLRTIASICVLAKASGLIIASAPIVLAAYNSDWAAHDLMRALGAVTNGCRYSGIAGLQFARAAGSIFRPGAHYITDKRTPNEMTLTAQSPAQFAIYSRNNSNTVFTTSAILTTLTANVYDNGGASTAGIPTGSVSTNNWQALRLWLSPNGFTIVQYGTASYASLAAAKEGVFSETFYPAPITDLVPFRGYLFVRGGASNLNTTADAVFVNAGKLGDVFVF